VVRNHPELVEDPAAQAELAKCRVAIVGMPDDTGVELNHGRVGARNGPSAFRAALNRYGVAMPLDEPGHGRAYPRIFDAGDVIVGRNIHETHDRVSSVAESLVRQNLFPIGIGGGHDLTFAFVRGVARALSPGTPMAGAYIDAHLDVRQELGSGMPFRALMDDHYAANLRCVGLNPLVTMHEHAEYFRSHGGAIHLTPPAPDELFHPDTPAFLSLDMDAFDGAHAPGVSAVNPCGLSPREVEPLIRAAGRNPMVRCFDIMELNPDVDNAPPPDGRTARLAVHMFLTFLRGVAERFHAAETQTGKLQP
jgi:formiminoglutamase